MAESKKRAIDIVIDSFLKRVEEEGCMPWQNPHKFGVSINWVSKKMYRGINRIILPNGEYMTKNQLNAYNKEHNEDYRFQKGIEWFPVVFYTKRQFKIKSEDLKEELEGRTLEIGSVFVNSKGHKIGRIETGYIGEYMVLKYSLVAEIKHFKNSKGKSLPRRIGEDSSYELFVTKEEHQKVIDDYIKRSGVTLEEYDSDSSFYSPKLDLVHIGSQYKWSDAKYSVMFHELAHSTGHSKRLNRKGITDGYSFGSEGYAFEECVAEMTASLLCQETGISTFVTSGTETLDNSAAYVRFWSKYIKDWGSKFVSVCKQAEMAYMYILGEDEESQLGGTSSREI